MEALPDRVEGESNETGLRAGNRPVLAGVEVRDEDLEPQKGLHFTAIVFRISAVVIFLLAAWQFVAWWLDRPPGGVGIGLLVGDTIRLIVISGLLWAAGELASLLIATHYDVRAARILLARQTYMMRQFGLTQGSISRSEPEGERRISEKLDGSDPVGS